jgi:hypothetical protein
MQQHEGSSHHNGEEGNHFGLISSLTSANCIKKKELLSTNAIQLNFFREKQLNIFICTIHNHCFCLHGNSQLTKVKTESTSNNTSLSEAVECLTVCVAIFAISGPSGTMTPPSNNEEEPPKPPVSTTCFVLGL